MKITTCVPVYNGSLSIWAALHSLQTQTRLPDEVIVIDDCSTDDINRTIEEFSATLPLTFYRNSTNLGMIGNWNACLEKATGDVITFLHQDDGYLVNFLETVEKSFIQNPKLGFWACLTIDRENIGKSTKLRSKVNGVLTPQEICPLIYTWKHIPAPTSVAFSKQALDQVGFYNDKYRYVAEPDLYFRLVEAGYYFEQHLTCLVWRTTPLGRATEIFGHAPLHFKEWIFFLDDWSGHVLLDYSQNYGQQSIRAFGIRAGRSMIASLFQRNFNQAIGIFQVINVPAMEATLRKCKSSRLLLNVMVLKGFWIGLTIEGKTILRKVKKIINRVFKNFSLKHPEFRQRAAQVDQQMMKLFNQETLDLPAIRSFLTSTTLYDLWSYYLCGPHYQMPWDGKKMSKLPMDYWVYRDLIHQIKPEVILEIGTCQGASALMLAEIGKTFRSRVVTVDIAKPSDKVLQELTQAGVIFILGDATEDIIANEISALMKSKRCLVIDDGSHREDDVRKAFEKYANFIPVGGYYVIEDGFSNWLIDNHAFNVLAAVNGLIIKYPDWQRYREYDQFILLTAFQGILIRKK